ncbi:MAG: DUF3796 domain-containing protein [Lachnospiraceae bacterium]|nr:DUF3796 domain-containing protein [Lachnospiraceae bacterium]
MKRVNYLGFLSVLSLIGLLGFQNQSSGLYGFFGFLYFVRYFRVLPDELFLQNVRKSATCAFLGEMISLVPFMFLGTAVSSISAAIPMAFASSFVVAVLCFAFSLILLEWREQKGAGE